MERVGQTLNRTGHHGSGNATDLTKQILADPRVASFIQEHSLSQDEIKRSLPKFNQFLVECRKVKEGDASYIAKGYEPILTMNEGYADVTYKETRQLKEQQEQQAIAKRINLVSLPQSYRKITFADIALDDVARVDTFESLVDFVANYPSPDQKGLYIYGDMGGWENPSCWLLWLMNFQRPRRLRRPLFITHLLPLMLKMESRTVLSRNKLMLSNRQKFWF